jgi:hypothetical protein
MVEEKVEEEATVSQVGLLVAILVSTPPAVTPS